MIKVYLLNCVLWVAVLIRPAMLMLVHTLAPVARTIVYSKKVVPGSPGRVYVIPVASVVFGSIELPLGGIRVYEVSDFRHWVYYWFVWIWLDDTTENGLFDVRISFDARRDARNMRESRIIKYGLGNIRYGLTYADLGDNLNDCVRMENYDYMDMLILGGKTRQFNLLTLHNK